MWFVGLCSFLLFWFRGAFRSHIFQDDFYLFVISRASDLRQFLNFFFPLKSYGFYRPLGIEVFYFLSGLVNNLFTTRLLVFGVFFTGLFFLHKIWRSRLATFMYAISFIHVFQLYWLATFQEVAVFTFGVISVYLFLKKSRWFLFFYGLALLSREEAMILPIVFLFLDKKRAILPFCLSTLFFVVYKINFSQVITMPEYAPHFNFRLISNNILWYGLWGLGLPNFLPDFWPSILGSPSKELLVTIRNSRAGPYLVFLILYLIFLAITTLRNWKKVWRVGLVCSLGFLIFILPMSAIVHKWMVRLTIPLVFVIFFQAYVISKTGKVLAVILLVFYILYNFFGVAVHEKTSTYFYESQIVKQVEKNLDDNRRELFDKKNVYFADEKTPQSGWEGSRKLKLTLFDQWFLKYYFPDKEIKAVYGFEEPFSTGLYLK